MKDILTYTLWITLVICGYSLGFESIRAYQMSKQDQKCSSSDPLYQPTEMVAKL